MDIISPMMMEIVAPRHRIEVGQVEILRTNLKCAKCVDYST